ncbi:MAG: tagatose 6 phosphate kinase [Bacteriovoracaceae bacterium]|nr:tagatose 6 phosphate kinase [Bacteriovoracaceae bacterium]
MSKNIIDAVVRFANRIRKPVPLIASRRQIECRDLGGGYVEKWATEDFGKYIGERDIGGFVPLCRDHGGPWQGGAAEENLSILEAMERAQHSMMVDLESGFQIIHIDPSIRQETLSESAIMDMLFDLYASVVEKSQKLEQRVEIEVGSEQQSGSFSAPEEILKLLKQVTQFCDMNQFQRPLFCVVQTGTLVKEMRNIGLTDGRRNENFDQKYCVSMMEKNIRKIADLASANQIYIKEHNGDYLSDGSMALRKHLGVGGVNLAPELGVLESKTLITVTTELGLKTERDAMLKIFYESKKWEKWLIKDSESSDLDRAMIAGHYNFSNPEFLEIKAKIEAKTYAAGFDLDDYLRQKLEGALIRYVWNLGYFEELEGRISMQKETLPSILEIKMTSETNRFV